MGTRLPLDVREREAVRACQDALLAAYAARLSALQADFGTVLVTDPLAEVIESLENIVKSVKGQA